MNPPRHLDGAGNRLYTIHEPEEIREQTRRATCIVRVVILLPMAICATPGAAAPGGPPVAPDLITRSGCAFHNIPQLAAGYELMLAGRFADAFATFHRGLDDVDNDAEKERASGPAIRACLMNMMGFAELQQGRSAAAAQWFQRGLALHLPPGKLVACLTSNLATAYFEAGQIDMAEETALRAARIASQVFGSEDPETLFAQATLAAVHLRRGDGARAEPVLRRILSKSESTWGASSYEASLAAANLAAAYAVQRQFTQAQSLFEKSLDSLRRHPSRAVHEIAVTETSLALAYAAGGRRREAEKWLERALASARRDLASEDPALAVVMERSANTLFILKDYESGRQKYEQALTLLQSLYGRSSQPVLDALERYEELLRDVRDKTRARDVADRRHKLMR